MFFRDYVQKTGNIIQSYKMLYALSCISTRNFPCAKKYLI